MKKFIIILLFLIILSQSVNAQENYISNYTKFHSDVIESFTDAYLVLYRKLSDGYVNSDFEDGDGIPVFYLYKNKDIYIHTVFLTDGISLVFTPQFYSSPKNNDFEVQFKDIHDYIVDSGISYDPRLEGKFSATGDNDRLRYKYTYGEMEPGSQPIKKENEIRIIYHKFILNKTKDERKKYAEYIADLDFVQDKWIVENYQNLKEENSNEASEYYIPYVTPLFKWLIRGIYNFYKQIIILIVGVFLLALIYGIWDAREEKGINKKIKHIVQGLTKNFKKIKEWF